MAFRVCLARARAGRTALARRVRSHDSSDFHLDTEALADQLVPQHQYKVRRPRRLPHPPPTSSPRPSPRLQPALRRAAAADAPLPAAAAQLDAASLAGRHFGEASCREYRESVLEVLPHRWTERGDTRFALAHFRKHRHRGAQAQAAEERAKAVRPKALGHAPDKVRSRPAACACARRLQREGGAPARWLSHPLPSLSRPQVQKAIGKVVGAAGLSAAASADPQHTHAHALPPNVIVAHLRDGIEAIHLYTGRTVCKLLLPTPELHVDINADGAGASARGGSGAAPVGARLFVGGGASAAGAA